MRFASGAIKTKKKSPKSRCSHAAWANATGLPKIVFYQFFTIYNQFCGIVRALGCGRP
jgi:hypothetical protein